MITAYKWGWFEEFETLASWGWFEGPAVATFVVNDAAWVGMVNLLHIRASQDINCLGIQIGWNNTEVVWQ
jgi:hypothetical protein